MTILQELEAMRAPRKVLEAGRIIDEHQEAGLHPPTEFVEYVRSWVSRNRGNDRYGNSLAFQTFALPCGEDVTLNIGLGLGSIFHARATVPSRLRVWSKVLPKLMEPGYMSELVLTPSRVWFGEPMMVVQGTFKTDVHLHDMLWQAMMDSGQDCIAYFVHSTDTGCLFGPNRDKWGDFNINFFSFLGDKHG